MAEAPPGEPVSDEKAAGLDMRNAIAWLARVADSYAAPGSDGLALILDRGAETLLTPDISADGTRLGLHLPTLTFHFLEGGVATPHPLDVDGRSSTEVEAWLLAELLHRNFDRERFQMRLPYAWDGLMSGDAVKYTSHDLRDALRRHTGRLIAAADALENALSIGGGDATEIVFVADRCSLAAVGSAVTGRVEIAYAMDADEIGYHILTGAGHDSTRLSTGRDELASRLADVIGSAKVG